MRSSKKRIRLVGEEWENGKGVLVVGGGVIGMSSAWVLAKKGHDVTIVDSKNGLS